MASQIIFDSLPYFDNELEQFPGLREKVEKELAKELDQGKLMHPRVPPSPKLFARNPLLLAELERVEVKQPPPSLDNLRYQLPAPKSPATVSDWKEALNNAHAQLEHQRIRHTNLALMQTYGPNAHRISNHLLEETAKQVEKASTDLRQLTTDLNRARKASQTQIGSQLNILETRWTQLISSVLQIEMANVALDSEIERLNKREAELGEL